jgi:hypothetical protein
VQFARMQAEFAHTRTHTRRSRVQRGCEARRDLSSESSSWILADSENCESRIPDSCGLRRHRGSVLGGMENGETSKSSLASSCHHCTSCLSSSPGSAILQVAETRMGRWSDAAPAKWLVLTVVFVTWWNHLCAYRERESFIRNFP